jgi:hypothetical protein
MQKGQIYRLLILSFLITSVLFSCKNDDAIFGGETSLSISTDTVYFDTVFTRVSYGKPISVTKQFVVVNHEKERVVTNVSLAGGLPSPFRINVDGEHGTSFSDVEIRSGDSIFVFVELTVDPNGDPQALPLIVRDSIIFTTNGRAQDVKLIAWGQDAHYFRRDSIETDVVWSDKEKPYLIYDYMYVKEGAKLTIEPGVRVHFSPYSWLWVEGSIEIKGTKDEPVFMEGDRLQTTYDQVPGQWNGIRIHYPSKDNVITHLRSKNGTVGVYCDSISSNNNPNLIVRNSEFRNMQFDGISGRMSSIVAQNCIMVNCGRFGFYGSWGGTYDVRHCTIYTGSGTFARRDPTCVFSNVERDDLGAIIRTFDLEANVANTIMFGNTDDELGFDIFDESRYQLNFVHNIFKTTQHWTMAPPPFNNRLNVDPKFVNAFGYDFKLDSLSPAIDDGFIGLGITKDFCEETRDASPDIGAYEYLK